MKNIVLIGMPGSGKSTVGIILAKELCMDFIDTDVVIQQGEGVMLQELYDRHGSDGFLDIEARYVGGLDVSGTVIAPGGSVVLNDTLMRKLKQRAVTIFLDVPVERIKPRIDLMNRGTVRRPGETLDDVWRVREPLYRTYADHILDCGEMTQLEIACRLAGELRGALD